MIESAIRLSTQNKNMVNQKRLLARDAAHIWPPCTPLKPEIAIPRLVVEHAEGCYLQTNQGVVVDAISSWWCKALGHRPKSVIEAIEVQLQHFEHVIGANTTYPAQVELAERLTELTQKQHVFFASDGSSAVEIALKLAVHAMQIKGMPERCEFVTLENSYHGETLATLSVSDVGLYKQPFEGMGPKSHVLEHVPYVSGEDDALWHDCGEVWPQIEAQLEAIKHHVCGVIVEPILQGAGGMKVYSADFLKRLSQWAKQNTCYLIADEIMTGLGRTGRTLALEHAGITADLICLSKALTAGTMPLSCVLIDDEIYNVFHQNPEHPFLHSHTYTGHALGVAAALATLKDMQRIDINQQAKALGAYMKVCFEQVAASTGRIQNIRTVGGMIAGDLIVEDNQVLGRALSAAALARGVLLRPLGNTLYWFPPLTADNNVIDVVSSITAEAIREVFESLNRL
ncbi:MAG: adenosylmethionine--8-amino-7-oxononanoate transaminase [Legionellaceae bacterium]|nr:adenosylmethionine--8-amino-7-oxononanoate transaminase [Legionellaceae bacterium]